MKTKKIIWVLLLSINSLIGQNLSSFRLDNGLVGYKNEKGVVVISPKFTDAFNFEDGMALVHLNGNWGFINKTGEEIIPLKYNHAFSFSEGLAGVLLGSKVISDDPEKINSGGKWGFINKSGQLVISEKFDNVHSFKEGLAIVEINNKWGVIDQTGKEVSPPIYDEISTNFSEGLAAIRIKDMWGIIDESGMIVVPLKMKYKHIDCFSNARALVKKSGEFFDGDGTIFSEIFGYIDQDGNEVIPSIYSFASAFKNGKAKVEMGGRIFFIDKNGNEIK